MRSRSLLLAAATTVAFGAASAQTKWDLPAAYPATNFHSVNLMEFAADVDKATAGKLKITVHPGASLFKAPEIKRAVQGGQAQIGEVLISNFSNEWALFGADALPFLADSYDQSVKLWQASKPLFDKKLAEQGMLALYSVPWPPQGIYSKKPLTSAADMKGVKFRAYNPATSRIAELVGAQPVTVQAAEVSQAFATGVADSMISSGSTGWDAKLHEHVKYWYDTQAWLPRNLIEGQRRVARQAEGGWHEHPAAAGRVDRRHEEGRRHAAQGVARQGRPGRQTTGRRLPQVTRG
jgi:TRAP-type C4-dicarboxylate transport system substrate-binding protein